MSLAEIGLALGIGSLLGTIWLRHQDEAVYLEQVAALETVLASARPSYREHCIGTASGVPMALPAIAPRADLATDHGWSATLFVDGAGRLELRGVDRRHAQRLASRFHGKADDHTLKLPLPATEQLPGAAHQRRFLRQYASTDSDVCALR